MKKLNLQESSQVFAGKPSKRRCDRLMRRYLAGSDSAGDTWLRIC